MKGLIIIPVELLQHKHPFVLNNELLYPVGSRTTSLSAMNWTVLWEARTVSPGIEENFNDMHTTTAFWKAMKLEKGWKGISVWCVWVFSMFCFQNNKRIGYYQNILWSVNFKSQEWQKHSSPLKKKVIGCSLYQKLSWIWTSVFLYLHIKHKILWQAVTINSAPRTFMLSHKEVSLSLQLEAFPAINVLSFK